MKNADMPAQAVSAESSKAVERFDCTNGGAQFCQGCYTMTSDSEGEYVRHEDYAKLEQQRAALVEALIETRTDLSILRSHVLCAESYDPSWEGMPSIIRQWIERNDAALKAAGVEL